MVYKHSVFRIYFVVDKPSIDNEQYLSCIVLLVESVEILPIKIQAKNIEILSIVFSMSDEAIKTFLT